MAEAELYGFDEQSTKRIAEAVRRVEKLPRNPPTPPRVRQTPIDSIIRVLRVTGYPPTTDGYQLARIESLPHGTQAGADLTRDYTNPQTSVAGTLPVNVWALDPNQPGTIAAGEFLGKLWDVTDEHTFTANSNPTHGYNVAVTNSGDKFTDYLIPGDVVAISDASHSETATVLVVADHSITLDATVNDYTTPTIVAPGHSVFAPANVNLNVMVRVTSLTPNADGMQPGVLALWSEITNAWSDGAAVWVLDASSGSGAFCGVTEVDTLSGSGLSGGGTGPVLSLSLTNTGVTAGTYGDVGHVARVTVDAQGRVSSVSEVAITTVGGASQAGQVLVSVDGISFSPRMPVVDLDVGWLVNSDGLMIVS